MRGWAAIMVAASALVVVATELNRDAMASIWPLFAARGAVTAGHALTLELDQPQGAD